MHVLRMMVLAMMGTILARIFTSSTCVVVQTFHEDGCVFGGRIAALSNHLNWF